MQVQGNDKITSQLNKKSQEKETNVRVSIMKDRAAEV